MNEIHAERFERVTQNLAAMGLTQMVVSDPPTIFYLTGVRIFHPGERMLALLLKADGGHRMFVNALFGTPDTDIPVENYLDGEDAAMMKGKRILIVDDVISTGESLKALETLVEEAGGIICGRMAVLAEGDAQERSDLVYLEKLPLFNPDGSVKG